MFLTQEMCDKAIVENAGTLKTTTRIKKCAIKLLILIFLQYNLFPIEFEDSKNM